MKRRKELFKYWLLVRGPDRENTLEDAFSGGYHAALEDVRGALAFMNIDAHPLYLKRDYTRANRRGSQSHPRRNKNLEIPRT